MLIIEQVIYCQDKTCERAGFEAKQGVYPSGLPNYLDSSYERLKGERTAIDVIGTID